MPSPFLGMDPYIEAPHIWEDFHQNLAAEIQNQLAPYLRPRYYAALMPLVSYEEVLIQVRQPLESAIAPPAPPHWVKPDVSIYATGAQPFVAEAVLIPPAPYMLVEDEYQETNVEVREVETGDLVTAIEILSPINKRPGQKAFDAYRKKRQALVRSQTHLLEIDLLRAGRRTPRVLGLPPSPYFVFLSRASGSEDRGLAAWPLHFRASIPVVPVPLRYPDPDVPLDLGKAIHAIYDRAAYDLRLDYTQAPPAPALTPADAQWLAAHLRAAHVR